MKIAKSKMNEPEEKYYKISEVAGMLDVSVQTLRCWENEIEQLDPPRTSGGARRYRPDDIEVCKLIKHLLRDKGFSLEYAKTKLSEYYSTGQLNTREKMFSCKSAKDALRLLSELKIKCEGDIYAVARIEAVKGWIKTL